MALGRVKWFSNEKGYGFIEAAESQQDVFVHFSDIVMEGYKTLHEDEMVFFVLEQGAKGPGARHVCPLHASEPESQACDDALTHRARKETRKSSRLSA